MSLLHLYPCPCTCFQRNNVGLIGDRLAPFSNRRGRFSTNRISQEHGYGPCVRLLSPTNWLPSLLSAFCKVGFVVCCCRCSVRLFVTRCDNAFESAPAAFGTSPRWQPFRARRETIRSRDNVLPFARPTLATYKKRRRKETLVLCRLVAVQARAALSG